MIARRAALVAGAGALALAACAAPPDDKVAPVTADEQKALADAKSMIPASELPPETATPVPTESAAK